MTTEFTVVVALGDSITAGAPQWDPHPEIRAYWRSLGFTMTTRSQITYWIKRNLGVAEAFNCGVGGDPTFLVAKRLDDCTDGADVVIIQAGGNDLFGGRAPALAARSLRAMVRKAKRRGLKVLLADVPPANDRPRIRGPRIPDIRATTRQLNRLIHRLGRREGVKVLPFYEALEDPRRPGHKLPRYASDDGVHPSIEGYRRLARLVTRADVAKPL